ncbi:ABC transporter ATP-binding protein [Paenibacillus ferrarius]|uniref:ABC transporter ATP-binding protein n=1 Tax=Paenibacillus ferrarius TaxID=1469647 RepID=UPI003D2BB98B
MEIYHLQDISFTFPEQERPALADITLTIASGQFVTICGQSGSGKSTLLRHLKPALTPHGRRTGSIAYHGQPLDKLNVRAQAADIGFVLQSPDNQIVTDKVWHELAFGLESLGLNTAAIRLRVAEMASFFGMQAWFHKSVAELSGGQKQLLNLASIMAMQPSVLILDEPTSQLDPIAAVEFLETVSKINRELGTTIIMTEHRLEEVLPLADRLVVLDRGEIVADGAPAEVADRLRELQHPMHAAMPTPLHIYAGVPNALKPPLTVKEGRQWLDELLRDTAPAAAPAPADSPSVARQRPTVIQVRDAWFRYERDGADVIKDLALDVREGEFACIVGGNGTGKTTMLSLLSGELQPYRGKVQVLGHNPAKRSARSLFERGLAILPQNPTALFVQKTVEQDLYEMLSESGLTMEEKRHSLAEVVQLAELDDLLCRHPYDLSGGEQQRAALAKVLLLNPRILLLDEPTKGLDAFYKAKLGGILSKLHENGVTILLVSHDIEFCARYGERCAMFFDGSVVTAGPAAAFFAGNRFYTTAANRMARHLWPSAVLSEEVRDLCQQSLRLHPV